MRNLQTIERALGSQNAMIEATGKTSGYISQILRGKTPIGETAARSLEASFKKPEGWLDLDRTQEPDTEIVPAKPVDELEDMEQRMRIIFEATRDVLRDSDQRFSRDQLIDIYKQAIDLGMHAALTSEQLSAVLKVLFKKSHNANRS